MKKGFIYTITCSITNKIYVGSTSTSLEKRWSYYKNLTCKSQILIYRSLVKYGVENHIFEEIWSGCIEDMLMYECLVGTWNEVLDKNKGLNLSIPKYSDKYESRSQETKDKIRDALKGKLKGPMSEENKLKISQGSKGKTKREGHGSRISATVAAQKAAGTHYTQQPKQTCPHCGIQASKARYNGYHGANCASIKF